MFRTWRHFTRQNKSRSVVSVVSVVYVVSVNKRVVLQGRNTIFFLGSKEDVQDLD